MSADRTREVLAAAATEPERVRRHLLMAAAMSELLTKAPVVVGGTAEEFWTADAYHPTDLELCGPVSRSDAERVRAAGFLREGRHWFHPDVPTVAVEFPDSRLDGDPERVHVEDLGIARVPVIGLDDLYLDRLRQATANRSEGSTEFMSTLAIAVARYEDLDRPYIDRVVQARARRSLSEGPFP